MEYRFDSDLEIQILFLDPYLKLTMQYKYHIEKDGSSHFLFQSGYLHKNEGPAIIDLESMLGIQRNLELADTVRDIYGDFHQRYDHVSMPMDLLRILLANGYSIRAKGQKVLYKDHFKIVYIAICDSERIEIEQFYFTLTDGPFKRLQSVANWSDRLCGCPGLFKEMIFKYIEAGFSIYADSGKLTLLIEVDTFGKIISVDDYIAKFLLE